MPLHSAEPKADGNGLSFLIKIRAFRFSAITGTLKRPEENWTLPRVEAEEPKIVPTYVDVATSLPGVITSVVK